MRLDWTLGLIPVFVIALFVLLNSVRILRDYERAVIFRFGRQSPAIINPGGDGNGPGLLLLIPFVDKMVKVSLRTVVMDVPPQDVITRDNVSVKVNAVIFFRVLDANKAVISVEDYLYATSQMAQTTLRSVLGQQELDDLLASREKINEELDADHRPAHEPLGREGGGGRGQERGPAAGHAAGDVEAGGGRARAAGEGDQRRGRVPGRGEAGRGRRRAHPFPHRGPAPVPADYAGDRIGAKHHDILPAPHRPVRAAPARSRREPGAQGLIGCVAARCSS